MSRTARISTVPGQAVNVLAGYLVLVAVVLIYYPIGYLFFAGPDDPWMLLRNEVIHPTEFDLSYLVTVLRAPGDIQYSPVNTLYYYLIYQLNGYDPYYFHLFSFVFHLANMALVYILVKVLLDAFAIERAASIAYIVTFCWAVHPFNVESVVWIAASKVVLFSFFAMLSMIWFVQGYLQGSRWRLVLSMVGFGLSCLCKEQALVMPVLFAAFLVCHRLQRRTQRLVFAVWPWMAVSFLISLGTCLIFLRLNKEGSNFPVPIAKYSLWERFILSFYCLRFYLTGFMAPVNLHFHYVFPFAPGERIPVILYLYPLFFAGFSYFVGIVLRQSPHKWFFMFCILFFLIHIGLVLQLIPMTRNAITADRYMYVPLLPLLMMVVHLAVNYWKGSLKNKLAIPLLALYMIALTVYAQHLAENWVNFNLIPYEQK